MSDGPHALGAPLTNPELSQHLQMQAARYTSPSSPDYVGNANAAIHGVSYEYLDARVAGAEHNLVNDDHELDTEELEDELEELKSWLDFDLRALRKALRDPVKARELMKTISRTLPPAKSEDTLTLEEVHRYLRALEKDKSAATNRDKEMHAASIAVVATLVDDWRRNEIGKDAPLPKNRDILAHPPETVGTSLGPGVPTLETHIAKRRGKFEQVTKQTIQELGGIAVDASGARERIATFFTEELTETTNEQTETQSQTPDTSVEPVDQSSSTELNEELKSKTTADTEALPTPQSERSQIRALDEQIRNADEQIIFDAIDTEIEASELALNTLPPEYRESRKGQAGILNRRLENLQSTADAVCIWLEKTNGSISFPDFIERAETALQSDEYEGDDAIAILDAETWIKSGAYYKAVKNEITRTSSTEESTPVIPETLTGETENQDREAGTSTNEQTEDYRDTTEKSSTPEIPVFRKVVEYTKSKTHLYTDVINGYRSLGDGDKKGMTLIQAIPINKEVERSTQDYKQHLNEAVAFSRLVKPDTVTVWHDAPEPPPKKLFGRAQPAPGRTYTNEPHPSAGQPIYIEHDGTQEPTVRFRYNFGYSLPAINNRAFPRYPEFQGGRDGQYIQLAVDLPESVANELRQQIEEDPASARVIAERLFLQNNDGVLTEELWREGSDTSHNPIRPPYEQLPEDWNIAIVEADEIPEGQGVFKAGYSILRKLVNSDA